MVTNGGGAVTSTVATLTVNCTFSLSASSVSFDFAGGSGSVNVLAQNGCVWGVTGVPAWITITSGNGGSGNGTVNYTVANNSGTGSRSATLIIAGHNYAVTQGAPDLTQPTVTISSPAANATVTNTVITVSGSADDDTGLASVEWRVGSSAFAPATGTTAWSAQVTLAPGTNVVGVRSVDLSGNLSLTNTRSFFCAVPGTLNLAIKGQGHVKGGTNGQQLEIGRPYQLTAQPDVGCVFSSWSGDLAGNTPSLTFVMQSNVTVTANFVTNPFTPVKGVFTGLFYETNEVRLGCSGFFTFKPTDKGTYTASILILGKKSSASGRLNLDGTATNVIPRRGTNALTVTWAVDLGGSDQIRGTIGDGSWTAQLLGDRAVYSAIRPAPWAGLYTLAIPGTPGATLVPEGDSYGTARVEANGFVNLKGYLADHSSIAIRVSLSESGHWPLYASLYGGKGTLLGWVTLADQTTTDFDGLMSWIKPALPTSKYYAGGFTNEPSLAGARYTPSTGVTNRILSLTNGLVLLDGGDLSQSFTNAVVLGPGNKLTNASPNSLALTFNPASGLFRGSFLPAGNTRPFAFKGAVLQKANEGSGYFLGTNQSGRVLIEQFP